MVVVGISGWRDVDLALGAVASARAIGWPVVYADGAYPLYSRTDWSTPDEELSRLLPEVDHVVPAPGDGPWPSEADKKSALVREAAALGAWVLILDTDERLEPGGSALSAWLADRMPGRDWLNIVRYRTPESGDPSDAGGPMSRLLRLGDGLHFRPPLDYEAWRGERRTAYMDGEVVPPDQRGLFADVPRSLLRIRHDRHLRPVERTDMTGRYCQRRREAHGVL